MLNYIWAGLIAFSLLFALIGDFSDFAQDTYRNEQPLPVVLSFPEGFQPEARVTPVAVRVPAAAFARHYGADAPAEDLAYEGVIRRSREGVQLRFDAGAALPEPLATIATVSKSRDDELQGTLVGALPADALEAGGSAALEAGVRFEPVRFVKLNAIAAAALDMAEVGATIALGLIGVLALFLGLLKIAEEAGLIFSLVKLVQPLLGPLFPEIPKGHPALGMIALNLTANIFGLGNAATPFGIKAMEELQTLNPEPDTATNPMVMLLAMNTASVQLVPPVLLLALLGLQVNQLIFAIIITTTVSLIVAITAAKLFGRMKGYRSTDPNRDGRTVPPVSGTGAPPQ